MIIKKFNEMSSNDFYQEVEYEEFCKGDDCDFDPKVRNKIIDFVGKFRKTKLKKNLLVCIEYLLNNGDELSIYNIVDEWYHVSIGYGAYKHFYKCDQLPGLLKLIEEILIGYEEFS